MTNEFLTTEELCGFTEEGFEDELWGAIPGYSNYYVSTKGRVFNNKYGRFKNASLSNRGYPYVGLYLNGERINFSIHRLVASVFVPNPDSLPSVRHLNDIKTDNQVENLAWGSQSENNEDGIRNGCWDNILRPIIAINNDTGIGYYYDSCSEASRGLGYSRPAVNSCMRKGYNIGGYRIEDADDKYLYDGIQNGYPTKHLFPKQKMTKRPSNSTKVNNN